MSDLFVPLDLSATYCNAGTGNVDLSKDWQTLAGTRRRARQYPARGAALGRAPVLGRAL